MFVWPDGTVTGSVNVDQLIAEHPDHPEAKRLLALRGEAPGAQAASEPKPVVEKTATPDPGESKPAAKTAPAKKAAVKKTAAKKRGS